MKINMEGIDCDCTPAEFFELIKLKREQDDDCDDEIENVVTEKDVEKDMKMTGEIIKAQKTMMDKIVDEYDDYKFPEISPLTAEGLMTFETMLRTLISIGSGKISMFDMANVRINEGETWNGITWRNFCTNFETLLPRIRKVMLMKDPKALRVQYLPSKDGNNYHYICFNGV
jgi:hypothetical protein